MCILYFYTPWQKSDHWPPFYTVRTSIVKTIAQVETLLLIMNFTSWTGQEMGVWAGCWRVNWDQERWLSQMTLFFWSRWRKRIYPFRSHKAIWKYGLRRAIHWSDPNCGVPGMFKTGTCLWRASETWPQGLCPSNNTPTLYKKVGVRKRTAQQIEELEANKETMAN